MAGVGIGVFVGVRVGVDVGVEVCFGLHFLCAIHDGFTAFRKKGILIRKALAFSVNKRKLNKTNMIIKILNIFSIVKTSQ
ncbi:hypothetical protein A3A74_03825 [Candidatus Roizmanbacteria bacterium RIFCSPLOWO2_01_FULL_35_13]|uniref:Uncharacterized protein n=1 Tax=Candidatus Roizmanbacteria bacterium RIFCSPLOWO2_01_FULL_35_13 TaxID=1802055 RepID=A0A1F7IBJ2_9BACT|nr:MAG: hypothetical protein A3A74_03825 [Candidatus Roizmanbacteria bacterium RIFCSPLOWO2_01_FULL_35_13]